MGDGDRVPIRCWSDNWAWDTGDPPPLSGNRPLKSSAARLLKEGRKKLGCPVDWMQVFTSSGICTCP